MFKEFFNKETNKKQRANMWTFSRLVTSFLIPIFSLISILSANFSLFIVSIFITGFGGLTDFLDGRSARKHNSFSEYGRLLDQVADKVFSMMIGINLSLFNPLFLITLLGEGLIVATNIPYKLKYKDLKIKSTQMGRIKQWPLFMSLVLGFISTILPNLIPATNIAILLTFISQLATVTSYIKSNDESIKKLKKEEIKKIIVEFNDDETKDKVKTKSIENKTNKKISKLEQYTKLRDLLNEIINTKESDNIIKDNNYQKTKK